MKFFYTFFSLKFILSLSSYTLKRGRTADQQMWFVGLRAAGTLWGNAMGVGPGMASPGSKEDGEGGRSSGRGRPLLCGELRARPAWGLARESVRRRGGDCGVSPWGPSGPDANSGFSEACLQ